MTLRPNEPQDLLKLKNILYFLGEFWDFSNYFITILFTKNIR